MVVKAVHIEIVSDYSSATFLSAFRRFCSRRGLPQCMYSDNGTTFQGAESELNKLFRQESNFSQDIKNALATDRVNWTYIPPKAPHFGGLWESKVKSFKHHLRRVIGETILTLEEFQTLAAQIEACINSRPLSPMTSDPEDMNALTPGHFLIGSPIIGLPEPHTSNPEINTQPHTRWVLVQRILVSFWRRWSKEVLHDYQNRVKWLEPDGTIKPGNLVLITDDLLPPARWLLGRVTECHPGSDGNIRVATIKTAKSVLTRPLVKLIKLPINTDSPTPASS